MSQLNPYHTPKFSHRSRENTLKHNSPVLDLAILRVPIDESFWGSPPDAEKFRVQGAGPASSDAFPVAMKTPAPTVTPRPRPTTSLVLQKEKGAFWGHYVGMYVCMYIDRYILCIYIYDICLNN